MSASICTCGPGREADGSEAGMCAHCEHIEDWRQGKRGDPSCPNCNGYGWYADGDALAGVQWPQTCDCVGQAVEQCVDDNDEAPFHTIPQTGDGL